MKKPVNLYFTKHGQTVVRYGCIDGTIVERCVSRPTALLLQPADENAAVEASAIETASALLFHAYRGMALRPELDWTLKGDFSPLFHEVFQHLLACLRKPAEERWCVRGEPNKFLHFGYRTTEGHYILGAFVLPWGKPTVFTFRAGDLIEALPPTAPFATMTIESVADGLAPQCDQHMGWDTRIRLPMVENGAALLHLIPEPLEVQ